jgi:hypothetical protein
VLLARDSRDLRGAYRDLLDGKLELLVLRPELLLRNGKTAQVDLTASLLRDADRNPSNYVTIIVDDAQP